MTTANRDGAAITQAHFVSAGSLAQKYGTQEVNTYLVPLMERLQAFPATVKRRIVRAISERDGEALSHIVNREVPQGTEQTARGLFDVVNAFYEKIDALETRLTETHEHLTAANTAKDMLGRQRDDFKQQYEQSEQAHQQTRNELDQKQQDLSDLRRQSHAYHVELTEAKTRLDERDRAYAGLENELQGARVERDQANDFREEVETQLAERTSERDAARRERDAANSERDAARNSCGEFMQKYENESKLTKALIGVSAAAGMAAVIGWGIIAYGGRAEAEPRLASAGLGLMENKHEAFTDYPFEGGVRRVFKNEVIGEERNNAFIIHKTTMLVDRAIARMEYNDRYSDDNPLHGRITYTGEELYRAHKQIAGDDNTITMREAEKALRIIGDKDGLYTKKTEEKK